MRNRERKTAKALRIFGRVIPDGKMRRTKDERAREPRIEHRWNTDCCPRCFRVSSVAAGLHWCNSYDWWFQAGPLGAVGLHFGLRLPARCFPLEAHWCTNHPEAGIPGSILGSFWVRSGSILGPSWVAAGSILAAKTAKNKGNSRCSKREESSRPKVPRNAPAESLPHPLPLSPGTMYSWSARGVGAPPALTRRPPGFPCSTLQLLPALIAPAPPPGVGAAAKHATPKALCVNNLHHQSTNCTTRQNAKAVQPIPARHGPWRWLAQCNVGCGRCDHWTTSVCSTSIAFANCLSLPCGISSGHGQTT